MEDLDSALRRALLEDAVLDYFLKRGSVLGIAFFVTAEFKLSVLTEESCLKRRIFGWGS